MSEKRRVLGSTSVAGNNNNDTPTRGARASPGVASTGIRVKAIINNNTGTSSPSIGGSSPSGNNAATPTSRTGGLGRSAFSPSASAAVRARARVLGYEHQQESTAASSPSTGSPLATSSVSRQQTGPSTPGAYSAQRPFTPNSTQTPSSSSAASSSSVSAAARAQPKSTLPLPPSSTDSNANAARKVRATSTPPNNDSPSISRPVSRPASPKRKAFPAFDTQSNQRSSSPSSAIGPSTQAGRVPRVRPISGVRSNTSAAGSLPRADPVKPPMYHSKSMTTRPVSASPNALLPSPTIRATPSSIFPSSSTSVPTGGSAESTKAGAASHGTLASQSPRPQSPVRLRPRSPARPPSPQRRDAFRPTAPASPYSPIQSMSPGIFDGHAPTVPVSPPAALSNAKRPSTSSQSSSSINTADTSATTNTTTTTAPTCFSPDPLSSGSMDLQSARTSSASAISASRNSYHRARRRSHSTNSSISSTSGLSNISRTKVLPGGDNTRHDRSGSISTGTSTGVGIGIKIPNASSSSANIVNMSTSPRGLGLASPHRQAPLSPGKGFFSEAEKLEQQAHLDAKIHRKILDLEITNTSLLAINASLEKAKAKQSAELRNLRRQIRDRTSFAPISSSNNLLLPMSDDFAWNPSISDDENEPELTWDEILKEDERFADIVRLLDSMNRRGQEALQRTVKSEEKSLGGPKVLNHFEITDGPKRNLLGSSKKSLTSTVGSGSAGGTHSGSSSVRSRVDDSTIEPDTTTSETETEAETTDQSSVQDTSRASSHQLESSDGDGSLTSSSFDVSRGMTSNSEFSISID